MKIVNYPFDIIVDDNYFNDDNKKTDEHGLLFKIEAEFIKKYLHDNKPRTILEIGTSEGKTTAMFSRCCPYSIIYTIDISTELWVGKQFKDKPEYKNIVQLTGASYLHNFKRLGYKFDLILIDGSHAYYPVICDSLAAFSVINKGGLIIWHDYVYSGQPEVTKAVNSLGNYINQLYVINKTSLGFCKYEDLIL